MGQILKMEAAKVLKMGDGRGKSEVNGEFLSLFRLRCLLLVSSLIYALITSTILPIMPPPRFSILPWVFYLATAYSLLSSFCIPQPSQVAEHRHLARASDQVFLHNLYLPNYGP